MPSGLKRFQRAESLHSTTFGCFHRLPLLEALGTSETVAAQERRKIVLSHPSRKRRGLDGARTVD